MADKSGYFASSPLLGLVTLNAPNTSRDGTGNNLFTVYTTNTDAIIEGILFNNSNVTGNTWSNRVLRVFIKNGGTNYLYIETLPKYLETPSDSVATRPFWLTLDGLVLQSGQSIVLSQSLYTEDSDLVSATIYGEKL